MTEDRHTPHAFASRVVILIALVSGAIMIWRMHDLLLLVFAAILVAVILHAAADGLRRILPLGEGIALMVASLPIVALLGGVGVLFGQGIGGQSLTCRRRCPTRGAALQAGSAKIGCRA